MTKEEQFQDQFTTCRRCQGNACYEQKVDENTTTWLCFSCGFSTSTLLTEDSDPYKHTIESSPELYKDLQFKDELGYVWFPCTITIPEKGMVFVDGTSVKDWKWASIKTVPIPEDEKDKYPEGQTHKMDHSTLTHFEQKDFMDSLSTIDFYSLT